MNTPDNNASQERSPDKNGDLSLLTALAKDTLRKLKKEKKRIKNIEADLAEASKADLLRKKGELLKANLNLAKRGMESIAVKDYFTGGETDFVIELDPSRPPKEQVNKFFKKAQKFERRINQANKQIDLARERIESLEKLSIEINTVIENGECAQEKHDSIIKRAEGLGLLEKESPQDKKPKPSKKEQALQKLMNSVRRFTSYDGLDILVGKSNTDNDTLTFRIAKGNDWWFHIAACPGSHVVVKNNGKVESLPQESMLDAATLAVYYSKMRGTTQADVHYTQTKCVRRIKGAPPGKVRLERNKSLRIRVEQSRLDRIFQE